jgi:hypothetical protein
MLDAATASGSLMCHTWKHACFFDGGCRYSHDILGAWETSASLLMHRANVPPLLCFGTGAAQILPILLLIQPHFLILLDAE